jgi:3-polyprenyl-4-hydroxybenzoate decarboxylase
MMVYFLLQAGGILLERRFLAGHSAAKILFVWLMVFVPSPLVINEGLLRTLHLWPEPPQVAQADIDPQRDSLFTKGPSDVLDHATSEIASGSKLGLDATKKIPGEGFKRPWPPLI